MNGKWISPWISTAVIHRNRLTKHVTESNWESYRIKYLHANLITVWKYSGEFAGFLPNIWVMTTRYSFSSVIPWKPKMWITLWTMWKTSFISVDFILGAPEKDVNKIWIFPWIIPIVHLCGKNYATGEKLRHRMFSKNLPDGWGDFYR